MTSYAITDATGRCLQVNFGLQEPPSPAQWDTPVSVVEVPDGFDGNAHYFVGAAPVVKPARPSKDHEFDSAAKAWVDRRTPATQWAIVRAERDARLAKSDWTQLDDTPLAQRKAWKTYRQALRDVPDQADPFAIVWPVPPA